VTGRSIAAIATCAGLLAACSASGPGQGAVSAATLRGDVLVLSKAAAGHDWAGAQSALARLRADLAAATATGQVSTARADAIRHDAAAVAADLAAQQRSATSSQHPSPMQPPRNPKPAGRHDDHGHGNGDGGGDGGD
jgi:hypothetical protein